MGSFGFYIELGLGHVLDLNAYDHILFLMALTVPYTFRMWKQVLTLVTIFTVAHCLSLAFSVYELLVVDAALIEFLIPVTILLTALFNLREGLKEHSDLSFKLQSAATGFFGLIHGFGFSNYFKMLMSGEEEKLNPLLGFATGIELSQVIVIAGVLLMAFVLEEVMKIPRRYFIIVTTAIVIAITLPMIISTWPAG